VRLVAIIRAAQHVPKKRLATKPTRGAKERRLQAKKSRATIKSGRGRQDWSGA
ncbi:MAG: aminoacyl-tRNA hydrolase, partial [Dokdonella sp.]